MSSLKSLQRKRGGGSSIGRLLVVLFFVVPLLVMAGLLSFLPQIGNLRSSVYPPQDLVHTTGGGFNTSGIQLYYAAALTAAAQTLNATGVIVNYPLGIVPSQFQTIMNSTNGLIQNFTSQMRLAGITYQIGAEFSKIGNYVDAANQLALAKSQTAKANSTLDSMDASFASMKSEGIQISAVQPRMDTLHGMVDTLFSEIASGTDFVHRVQIGAIIPANLTISASARTVNIGQSIVASGTLHSQGAPLSNQNISITYQGVPVGIATTDSSGNYSLGFVTPSNYTSSANITANFNPTTRYAPVRAVTFVRVSYYTTLLNLTGIPSIVVPGQPYEFRMNITVVPSGAATFPAPPETIHVYLFGRESNITYSGTNSSQFFLTQLLATDSVPNGPSTLVFNSTGDSNYAPLRFGTTVQVARQGISVNMTSPSFVNPFHGFEVKGNVSFGSPGSFVALSDGSVSVSYGNVVLQQRLSSNGTFSISVPPSLSTVLVGGDLSVVVVPDSASVNEYNSTSTVSGLQNSPGASTAILLVVVFALVALNFAFSGYRAKLNRGKSDSPLINRATQDKAGPEHSPTEKNGDS